MSQRAALAHARVRQVRRGFALEYATLAWNVIGIVVREVFFADH
jgi:hypothetical protein